MNYPPKNNKAAALLIAFITAWISLGPVAATVAQAQLATVDSVAQAERAVERVRSQIKTRLASAGVTIFFNALQKFTSRIAYDAANYIANGGKGQSALVYKKGFGAYLGDVADDAAGQVLGDLSDLSFFRDAGINLCAPPSPQRLLQLQLSIGAQFPGLQQGNFDLQPRCDFQQVIQNYRGLYTTLSNTEIYDYITEGISFGGSDLGVSLTILGRSEQLINQQVGRAERDREETGAFSNLEDIVSGNVRTPAAVIQSAQENYLVKDPATAESDIRRGIIGNAFQAGAAQLGVYTASVFINTLSSKVLNKVMQKGLIRGLVDAFKGNGKNSVTSPDAAFVKNAIDNRLANIDLREVNLLRNSEVEVLSDLYSCPEEGRNIWNCAMDENLAQIVTPGGDGNLTIEKAIEEGLLNEDWPLIPVTDAKRNQDRLCYSYGYCAGNLAKLRAMRIIPVGFEFAANSPENIARCQDPAGCVTLKEVIAGFADCNDQGTRDAQHPWCKLVDSNWVLTSFPQQCRLSGFGETLISSRTAPQRRDECRDIQTCLQRDENGQCVGGYGYCVAEKTTYRFNSTQCLERNASCRAYTTRTGQSVSYIRNTIDNAVCSADNVGCQAYYTQLNQDGSWDSQGPKMYADTNLTACAAGDDGCTKLLVAEVGGTALNLLQNGSFETSIVDATKLDGWVSGDASFSYTAPSAADTGSSIDGARAYAVANATLSQTVATVPGNIVTISASVRAFTPGTASVNIQANTGGSATDLTNIYRSSGCVATGEPGLSVTTLGTNWQRVECSFVIPPNTTSANVVITGSNALVDAIQFEENEYATAFVDGVNRSLPVTHMKVAPDTLNCQGLASDPEQCNKYARVCKQVDAGCQEYSETNSTDKVPAILSQNDLCPQQCVGYAEFRKQASAFDLVKDIDANFSDDADIAPSYFIPATANVCKQEDVGCETFTNVEQAAQGGETAQSFSYLRACEKPDPTRTKSFYVWEGSSEAGYQLRTFSLISDATILPNELAAGPKILAKRGTDGTVKEPTSCNEDLWRTGTDPDCRQFYDQAGNTFYRYYSQTVLSSDQCIALRISRSGQGDDCRKTGGVFTESTGECTYNAYLGESRTCQASVAGCRAYKGISAGSVQLVLNESFKTSRGTFSAGDSSEESVLVGDRSLQLSASASLTTANYTNQKDALYRVSFWAKAPGSTPIAAQLRSLAGTNPATAIGSVSIGADWQRYSLGLFSGPDTDIAQLEVSVPGIGSRLVFIDEIRVERVQDTVYVVNQSWNTPIQCDTSYAGAPEPQAMLGCRAYNDTFNNTVYAHRFTRLCKAEAIGCRAFVDTRNSDSAYAQSFEQADATPVEIANGAIPAQSYPSNTVERPADKMRYLVYDTTKLCKPENASCRAFGKPNYTPDRSGIRDISTVYLKDDITKYGEALCKPSEEFCEEFNYQGGKEYFRAPAEKACEYKEGIRLSSADFPNAQAGSVLSALAEGTYSGWFAQGSNTPCYPEILENGNTFGMAQRGDEAYSGWTAMCPASQDSCTEFRDVNDKTDPNHSAGKPYFFLNNDSIDKTSCAGQIDPANGCVLLRDLADNTLRYNAQATAIAYERNGYNPTAPVDCIGNGAHEACQALPADQQGKNDANLVVKVNLDRDCAQWLGCRSSETVFDTATRSYKDVCIDLALCDKSSGKPGDIFCESYVDRTTTATEPVLTEGVFFDSAVYASRQVGLGAKDYSGYALPNTFQISDTQTLRVGKDGLTPAFYPESANRFGQDYRLAARVRMPPSTLNPVNGTCNVSSSVPAGSYFARPLDSDAIGLANPNLNLCGYTTAEGKQIVGFYNQSECQSSRPFNCYLPVQSITDSTNFEKVAEKFKLDDPKSDASLSAAYPPAECRSNPEADSPFATSYVAEWDLSKTPPKPKEIAAGFENANTCEFGQDCACTYKRVTYNSQAKFFAPDAQEVPPGICIGGQRDGQTCIPSSLNEGSVSEGEGASDVTSGIQAAQSAYNCGQNSQCVAYNKLEIIKGVFGQCLERDTTQFAGVDQSNRPCLTWNPNPILFGDKDPFHYQPTAGYLPPQNAGQYYCTSAARNPVKVDLSFQHFRRYTTDSATGREIVGSDPASYIDKLANECDGGVIGDCVGNDSRDKNEADVRFANQFDGATLPNYVGGMKRLDLDPVWVDQGRGGFRNVASKKTPYISIDQTIDYQAYNLCDYSDKYTVPEERGTSPTALRLVDAGSGYRETFYRIHSPLLMKDLGYTPTVDNLRSALSDSSISFFKIQPSINGDVGRLACGYNAEWAEGMPSVDYKDQASLQGGEAAWRANFNQSYSPYLSRANEIEITNDQGDFYTSDCVEEDLPEDVDVATLPTVYKDVYQDFYDTSENDGRNLSDPKALEATAGKQCAFKAWEVSYKKPQSAGFTALEANQSLSYIRRYPIYDQDDACRNSASPWFSIRAVFQSPIVSSNNPDGQWTFVGFWTSACAGKSGGDHRYMYMDVEIGTADVCRELAEVKSSDTNQDAAFTDRAWKQSGYRDPATGATYAETNAPFSSALNTGIAGIEPLFQNGGEQAGFSPLNPPTFLRSGFRTYYSSSQFPRDKYAFLSNMFARVYRVYRYHEKAVTLTDDVCLEGPFKGTNCTIAPTDGGPTACSVDGRCDTGAFTATDRAQTRVCNIGPQSGLSCSSTPQCQGLGFKETAGTAILKIKNNCVLDTGAGWVLNGDGTYTKGPLANLSTSAASSESAFICDGFGNRNGGAKTFCSRPGTRTEDCAAIAPENSGNNDRIGATCVPITNGNPNKACAYTTGNANDLPAFFAANGVTVSQSAGENVPRYNGELIACSTNRDCQVTAADFATNQACTSIAATDKTFGRCVGGLQAGEVCNTNSTESCKVAAYNDTDKAAFATSCGSVTDARCTAGVTGDPNSTDLNKDANACTHDVGYYPRLDLCPNPANEYCGLVSYRITDKGAGQSMDPVSRYPLPTDVTLGHYTPTYLGLGGSNAASTNFNYITYYTPRPPMVAAPDIRNCAIPGQCEVAQTNAFNLSGQTSGPLNAGIGQFVASMRFYAWASHDQMPLKRIFIDWGDGESTKLADTKLKNHKPFCNVQSECSDQVRASGLTCNADGDCPAGAGICKPTGICQNQPQKSCSADAECNGAGTPGNDKCVVRTMFGNSRDACDPNYFDFQHVYVCNESTRDALIAANKICQPAPGQCSRDASRSCTSDSGCAAGDTCIQDLMAEEGGCWNEATNSCHFTPRLQVMDNWGWCTGECRNTNANGVITDSSSSKVLHPYGGCYAGANPDPEQRGDSGNINVNSSLTNPLLSPDNTRTEVNECAISGLPGSTGTNETSIRPWVVYPGAVQIRPSN